MRPIIAFIFFLLLATPVLAVESIMIGVSASDEPVCLGRNESAYYYMLISTNINETITFETIVANSSWIYAERYINLKVGSPYNLPVYVYAPAEAEEGLYNTFLLICTLPPQYNFSVRSCINNKITINVSSECTGKPMETEEPGQVSNIKTMIQMILGIALLFLIVIFAKRKAGKIKKSKK